MSGHPGRAFNLAGLMIAAVLLLLGTGSAMAQQPADCDTNSFDIALSRDFSVLTFGAVNGYTITASNVADPGDVACDIENVLLVFCCPDSLADTAPGHAPNENDATFDPSNIPAGCTVLSDGRNGGVAGRDNFPAPTPTITYPKQFCTMDGFFLQGDFKKATAKAQAGFDEIQFGELLDSPGNNPFNGEKALSTTITVCDVKVDKAVSCNGVDYVDEVLVSADDDGENGCLGWNAYDSNGDGSNDMSAEPLNIQYRVQNDSDAGQALWGCVIEESNGAITNVDIPMGDLLGDDEISSPFVIPGTCNEGLDDGEPDKAQVICFCTDPGSPDHDPNLRTAASLPEREFDTATFDCQTPDLQITKICNAPDSQGVDKIDIIVSNLGTASLINCVVTDEVYRDDEICGAAGTGDDVPLTPVGTFVLPPDDPDNPSDTGHTKEFDGMVSVLQRSCNRARVTCDIAGSGPNGQLKTISRTDDTICEPPQCEVQVDKQVSCDGGLTWLDDFGPVDQNDDGTNDPCIGWNAFDGVPAEQILVRYQAKNLSPFPVYGCSLGESNPGIATDQADFGTLNPAGEAGDSQTFFWPDGFGVDCSDALVDNNAEPDTATLSCFCSPDMDPGFKDGATDSANFDCQTPGLEVRKVCLDEVAGDVPFDIEVENTSIDGADLLNCKLTDTAFLDDPICVAGMTGGTDLIGPDLDIGDLAAGAVYQHPRQFMACPPLLSACNTATVTCNIDDGTGNPVMDNTVEPAVAKTITSDVETECECEGEDCFNRTPGFWGTHPSVTEKMLPLTSCGIDITHAFANQNAAGTGSSTEDMCFGGRDFKGSDTSSVQLQLIRQCMAAHLNLSATLLAGGSCEPGFNGINTRVAYCCEDLCANGNGGEGPTKNEINGSGCIGDLDTFNNLDGLLTLDDIFPDPGFSTSAEPGECREANGNGLVNSGRELGPRQ